MFNLSISLTISRSSCVFDYYLPMNLRTVAENTAFVTLGFYGSGFESFAYLGMIRVLILLSVTGAIWSLLKDTSGLPDMEEGKVMTHSQVGTGDKMLHWIGVEVTIHPHALIL